MKSDGQVINQVLQNDVRLVGILIIFLISYKDNIIIMSLSRCLKTVEERYLQTVDSDGNIFWEALLVSNQHKIILLLLQQCYLFSMRTLSLVAMIHHSMCDQQAVQELNPSQCDYIGSATLQHR